MSKEVNKQSSINQMIFLAICSCVLFFLVVVLRLGQIVIGKEVNGVTLEAIEEQDSRSSLTNVDRGSLFDRKGQPLALDTTSYSLYAVLDSSTGYQKVENIDHTAERLAEYLDLSAFEIGSLLAQEGLTQVEFGPEGKNLSPATYQALLAEELPGIYFNVQKSRHYIHDIFASHTLGYASLLDPTHNRIEGQSGIELAYDDSLSGYQIDTYTYEAGQDLYLTLSAPLQNTIEDLLSQAYDDYRPKSMGVYVVDLSDGSLLVAGQRPTYHLNSLQGIEAEWRNLLVEAAYEPGSTIKILTMGIAYDQKVYQPTELFPTGEVKVYDQIVRDYNLTGWGAISFDEGLARSSNTTMVELARRLGEDKWVEELGRFGFGQETHIQLPNEIQGEFHFDNPVSKLMSAFGQGFSATPIQLLQAYSAIGNQGEMLRVKVVDRIGEEKIPKKSGGQVLSAEASRHVLDLMVDSVEADYGIAKPFKHPTVPIAAKTGTAEVADASGSGYLTGDLAYFHSVISFFPADEPRYMLYLFMDQPEESNGRLIGQILGDLFKQMVDRVMIYE